MKACLCAILLSMLLALPHLANAAEARAALIKGRDGSFAVVHVADSAMKDQNYAERLQLTYEKYFKMPVVLMSDVDNHSQWHGRNDLVSSISSFTFAQLPWRIYDLSLLSN